MSNRYDLNTYETNAALDFFMHHLPMEQRRKLMNEMPVVYNKLTGRRIMATVNVAAIEDGDKVSETAA